MYKRNGKRIIAYLLMISLLVAQSLSAYAVEKVSITESTVAESEPAGENLSEELSLCDEAEDFKAEEAAVEEEFDMVEDDEESDVQSAGVPLNMAEQYAPAPVELPEDAEYVEGEMIVVYEDQGLSEKKSDAVVEETNESLEEALDVLEIAEISEQSASSGSVAVVELPEGAQIEEAIAQAQAEEGIAYAQPNYIYHLIEDLETATEGGKPLDPVEDEQAEQPESDVPEEDNVLVADEAKVETQAWSRNTDPFSDNQYYLENIKLSSLWDAGEYPSTKQNLQTIAVLDTGCYLNHEDFEYNIDKENAYDAVTMQSLTTRLRNEGFSGDKSTVGHGTMVCGVIAARAYNGKGIVGVSANAKVLPIKVFDDSGEYTNTSYLINGISYVLRCKQNRMNVNVINMSLGGTVSGEADRLLHQKIIEAKYDYGMLLVCAGGNSGVSTPIYPSDYEECFSVVWHDRYNYINKSADINAYKDIGAPGVDICSTYNAGTNRYAYLSGSSLAAPVVSGTCALLWDYATRTEKNPTASSIREAVTKGATRKWTYSYQDGTTFSIPKLDAYDALQYIKGTPNTSGDQNLPKNYDVKVTLASNNYTYTGGYIYPQVVLTAHGKQIDTAQYANVSYSSNLQVGEGSVIVTGKNGYSGTAVLRFLILPKGTSLSKVSAGKKAFTAKWKKQSAKMKSSRIYGYQIRYSTKKNMSGAKTRIVKGYKKTSLKVSGLKKKKVYYVQVRTLKKVGYYLYPSNWSKTKKVKTK